MKRLFIAAVLACVSLPALADSGTQPTGKYYVGLDVGSSELNAGLSEQFFEPEFNEHTGNDIGFRVRFGIQVSRYFAVEAGYVNFGEFSLNDLPYLCAPEQEGPCTFNLRSSTDGPMANIVVTWPFAEQWALNGRVGGYYADVSTSERDPDVPGSERKYDDSGFGLQIGAGLSYQINPRMKISADWGKFDLIAFGPTLGGGVGVYDLGSAELVSLGFAYRF